MTSDPLWTFACAFYGRPGVAAACLALQDEGGADVPLLLYLIWCGRTGRRLDARRSPERKPDWPLARTGDYSLTGDPPGDAV